MAEIRPRSMTQGELAELLRENGFPACSKAAVSLAERPKESGVQFTPEARNVAHGLLKSKRRAENRANPNKTTVWLDDETRIWLEERAYMEDSSVGTVIRDILAQAMSEDKQKHDKYRALRIIVERYMELAMEETPLQKLVREIEEAKQKLVRKIEEAKKAASDAGTSEAAQREGNMAFPLPSENTTNEEENQV